MTLADYLKRHGETASEFAIRTGISQPYVSRLVNRERFPRSKVIEKVRRATGGAVTADDMMPIRRKSVAA